MSKKKRNNGEPVVEDGVQALVAGCSSNPSKLADFDPASSPSISCTLGEEDSVTEASIVGDREIQSKQVQQQQNNARQMTDKRPQRNKGNGKKNPATQQASGQERSYRSLFPDNRDAPSKIKLEDFRKYKDAGMKAKLVRDDVDEHEVTVGHYLIGYVAGKFPGRGIIAKCCRSWNVPCILKFHTSEWLIFKFEKLEDRNKVLEGGPYYIFGKPLLLKTMPDCFNFTAAEIGNVQVWIQLPSLPLQLWNANALSKIASLLGKPMYTDGLTGTKERIDYARVLIEVDATVEPIESVTIELPNGDSFEQQVVYEFMPKLCKKCRAIGHLVDQCPYYKHASGENKQVAASVLTAIPDQPALHMLGDNLGAESEAKGRKPEEATKPQQQSGSAKMNVAGQSIQAEKDQVQRKNQKGSSGASHAGKSVEEAQGEMHNYGFDSNRSNQDNLQDRKSGSKEGQSEDKSLHNNQYADRAKLDKVGIQNREPHLQNCEDEEPRHLSDAGKLPHHDVIATDRGNKLDSMQGSEIAADAFGNEVQDQNAETAADDGFTEVKRKSRQTKSKNQQSQKSKVDTQHNNLQIKSKEGKSKDHKSSKIDRGKGLAPAYQT